MKNYIIYLRKTLLVFLTHRIGLPLIRLIRRPCDFSYTMADLEKMPNGSLGNDLYQFLKRRNLPLIKHYTRHDLKHILLGYDTTEEGEACLQSFMLGNGRISFPVLATVLFSIITMPGYWEKMKTAFRKGRAAIPVHSWSWNKLLMQPTAELRNRMIKK